MVELKVNHPKPSCDHYTARNGVGHPPDNNIVSKPDAVYIGAFPTTRVKDLDRIAHDILPGSRLLLLQYVT